MDLVEEDEIAVADSTIVMKMLSDYESVVSSNRELLPSCSYLRRKLDLNESLTATPIKNNASSVIQQRLSIKSSHSKPNDSMKEVVARKRKCEADLISANCKISRLEMKVNDLETLSLEAKIRMDKQIEAILLETQHDKHRREEMEVRMVQALENEAQAKAQLIELKKTFEMETNNWCETLKEKEEEWNELKMGYEQNENSQLNETIFMLESDLNRLQSEKEAVENDLECCQGKLNQLAHMAEEYDRLCQEQMNWVQEKEILDLRVKHLEDDLKQQEDSVQLSHILRKQLNALPDLETENRRLKEENRLFKMREDNVLLLKEQLQTATTTIEHLEKRNSEGLMLKSENELLKSQIFEWKNISLAGRATEPRSAQELAKVITEMQQSSLLSLEKVGNVTSRNHQLKKQNEQLEEELKTMKLQCQRQEVTFQQNKDHIRHLQRKLMLVSRERDLNRQLLDNYEKDMTITNQNITLTPDKSDKFSKMESIVEGYRNTIKSLETELSLATDRLVQLGFKSKEEADKSREDVDGQVKAMKEHISELECQVSQLTEANKALELKVEFEMVKGEYNPLKTRLVHLRSNPVAWAADEQASEVQSLKNENAVLRERVKVLEQEGALAADVTLRVAARLEQDSPEQVIEDLKAKLVAADIQKSRVKETFKKFSSQIREVTYKLLGYKIEQPCNNQYKLSSIYAESPNDYLIFSKSDDGGMQLLETPFSAFLSENISLYLHTQHNIPAFLASIILDQSK